MARLQDFSSVTPASSDNLLIVQSQGQGLATINTVGQKIANDANISSLQTTSKHITGAINELNTGLGSYIKKSYVSYASGDSIFEIPYQDLKRSSGRDFGMALVFAWKEIFAMFYNNDNTVFITPLTSGTNRTATVEYVSSTQKLKLTFSGAVWGGIAVYSM